MPSTEKVQNTHIEQMLGDLHGALLDIVIAMNRPQRDEALIREAGIALDRALFPLLVGIERFGPIGIVDLADRAGRDHTTVSRQVARLESLGLVARQADAADKRVRAVTATPAGAAMVARIDAARERIVRAALADWEPGEVARLVDLMRRFADAFAGAGQGAGEA